MDKQWRFTNRAERRSRVSERFEHADVLERFPPRLDGDCLRSARPTSWWRGRSGGPGSGYGARTSSCSCSMIESTTCGPLLHGLFLARRLDRIDRLDISPKRDHTPELANPAMSRSPPLRSVSLDRDVRHRWPAGARGAGAAVCPNAGQVTSDGVEEYDQTAMLWPLPCTRSSSSAAMAWP